MTAHLDPAGLSARLASGVIAFPVTPFTAEGALDRAGLRDNLGRLLEHPLAAVVAPGGTGEVFSLSPAEQGEVVAAAVEAAAGRVPVLAGVGINLPLGVQMAREAAVQGAGGLLAFPPYYPDADPEGLADYYAALAAATPLGLVVYSRDWVSPSPAWLERLADRLPTLVAWKDGTGDTRRCQQLIQRVGDRLRWIGGAGDDQVPPYYAIGIRCYTSSVANVAPRLSLRLHEAAARGDSAELGSLMSDYVLPLYELRSRRRGYEVTVMKEMMTRLGLAAGPVRPPLTALRPEDRADLERLVERWKPVL
jgi:5-dehydro-4-deoxyglucarate dehydratase